MEQRGVAPEFLKERFAATNVFSNVPKPPLSLAESLATPGHDLSAGRAEPGRSGAELRDGRKQAQTRNEGLLVDRSDFKRGGSTGKKEILVTGSRKDCIADATAMATEDEFKTVRYYFGEDRSFDRAISYVAEAHPDLALDDSSDDFLNVKGGVELALLEADARRFILQQRYTVESEGGGRVERFHCAFFDAGLAWEKEEFQPEGDTYVTRVVHGRGVLKDNQADVKVNHVLDSDRESSQTARDFFAELYPSQPDIRITRVYELVPEAVAARRKAAREERRARKRAAAHVGGKKKKQKVGAA